MNDIWLVRHGATRWSVVGRHTGRTDLPLTEAGQAGATVLAPQLAAQEFALVLTSPLQRARTTAQLAGFPHAEVCDDLIEWDYGEFEGKRTAEIREQFPGWTVWHGPWPGGEVIDAVAARAERVLARVNAADGPVLLFAHGHILRIFTAIALELAPQAAARFALEPSTLSMLNEQNDQRVIRTWNVPPCA